MKKTINKLIPKKTKFLKIQKGSIKTVDFKKTAKTLFNGFYALKVLKSCRLTVSQLEAARRKISRTIRKKEMLWLKVLPDTPITAKPNEIRMGKGKGTVSYWVFKLKAGKLLFELSNMPQIKAYYLLLMAKNLLPIPTKIVKKQKYILKKNESLSL